MKFRPLILLALAMPMVATAQSQLRTIITADLRSSGPFKLVVWKRAEYIELDRFAQYQPRTEPADGYAGRKLAKVDRIRFTIVGDPSSARAAVLAGNVDLWPAIDPKFAKEMAETGKVKVVGAPVASINTVVMQTGDPLLKTSLSAVSPKVRGYEAWAGRKPRLWNVELAK